MNYYVGDFPPNDYFNTPRGWVCPKCGRVYNPNTSMCWFCCGNDTTITTSNTNTPQDTSGSTPYKFPTTVTTTATIPLHDEISSFFDKLINNLEE